MQTLIGGSNKSSASYTRPYRHICATWQPLGGPLVLPNMRYLT
jgi:hypothetical protein